MILSWLEGTVFYDMGMALDLARGRRAAADGHLVGAIGADDENAAVADAAAQPEEQPGGS